ncbi:hypothetical protein LFM09_34270 [Lentzea alba]|uniref:baeRF2 domain-containing protein n=1 Tax=Lentzea alba TaxID=2714351 RepID=UPI0039BFC998
MTSQHMREMVNEYLRPTDPVASVYIGSPPVHDTGFRWTTRWGCLADQLRCDGAEEALIRAIEHAVLEESTVEAAADATGLVVFASEIRPSRVFHTPGLVHDDLAWFTAPAHVLPVVAWLQDRPSCVVVVTDQTGADLHLLRGGSSAPESWSVEGLDDEGAVAKACAAALDDLSARLFVVSGDEHTVQLLLKRLPELTKATVTIRRIAGSHRHDGSQRSLFGRVAAVARSVARRWTAEIVADLAERCRAGGLGVEGTQATLEALAQRRVETLLVEYPADVSKAAWFGLRPTDVLPGERVPPLSWPCADVPGCWPTSPCAPLSSPVPRCE